MTRSVTVDVILNRGQQPTTSTTTVTTGNNTTEIQNRSRESEKRERRSRVLRARLDRDRCTEDSCRTNYPARRTNVFDESSLHRNRCNYYLSRNQEMYNMYIYCTITYVQSSQFSNKI